MAEAVYLATISRVNFRIPDPFITARLKHVHRPSAWVFVAWNTDEGSDPFIRDRD